MKHSILVVEDDTEISSYIQELLTNSGFAVEVSNDGLEAFKRAKQKEFDLVLLDLNLPSMSGENLCSRLKTIYPNLPIIILTGNSNPMAMVKSLNLGADDYMRKPFDSPELLARIRTRLRNQITKDTSVLEVADLHMDTDSYRVHRGKKEIHLTPVEFKLLKYLMTNRERVLTRESIFNEVWPNTNNANSRVADVYVGYLRRKVDRGFRKKLIHSSRGFGYIIKE